MGAVGAAVAGGVASAAIGTAGSALMGGKAGQGSAQASHAAVQEAARGGRRLLAPEVGDEPVGGHHPVGAEQQQGEQRALLRDTQPHRPPVGKHLQRSKNPEPCLRDGHGGLLTTIGRPLRRSVPVPRCSPAAACSPIGSSFCANGVASQPRLPGPT